MVQLNFLTDILNLVYLPFAKNVQGVHPSIEQPAASWMWDKVGEVGGDSKTIFCEKLVIKT